MPVVHEDDLPWGGHDRPPFAVRRRQLGKAAGGQQLGCSLCELPPGARAWPRHWHAANEEAIYIIAGTGVVREGDAVTPVQAGSYVAIPVGPEHAHQLENTGETVLRYLCFSTMHPTDLAVYPDSGKVGIFAGAAPGGDAGARVADGFFPLDAAVPYWTGEAE